MIFAGRSVALAGCIGAMLVSKARESVPIVVMRVKECEEVYGLPHDSFRKMLSISLRMLVEWERLSIAQDILRKSMDFSAPIDGVGGVTLSDVCPRCHCFPLEDYMW